MSKVLYMKVTSDEYELPLAVADSVAELAAMVGVEASTVFGFMWYCKKNGKKCPYIKVEVEDDDDNLHESF